MLCCLQPGVAVLGLVFLGPQHLQSTHGKWIRKREIMKVDYLGRPCRSDLWAAFDQLMGIARQNSSSSFVARDLLVHSHGRMGFDIGQTHKFDSTNRQAAVVVIAHAVTGGDDREFGNYLKQKGLTKLEWLKDQVWV